MKNKKEIIISLLLGIFFVYFLNYLPRLENISECLLQELVSGPLCNLALQNNLFGLTHTISVIAVSFIVYKIRSMHLKGRKDTLIVSIILSIIIVIGKSYVGSYTLYVLFSSINNIIWTLLSFISYILLFNYLFKWLFYTLEKRVLDKKIKINNFINYIFYKDIFFSCVIIIFLAESLYFFSFYLNTILLDNDWLLLMYIIILMMIDAFVYSYILHIMNKMNINIIIRVITLLFFVSPIICVCSMAYLEDTLYYLLFLFLFTYQYYHLYYLQEDNLKNYVVLLIIMLFLIVLNSAGFYVVSASLICLLILKIKEYKKKNIYFIITMLILGLGTKCCCNNFYDFDEILAIPLEQTGRYVTYYSQDISSDEEETLLKLFAVYNLNEIGRAYDPSNLDNLKNIFISDLSSDEITMYFKLWINTFFKKPFSYFDAVINGTSSYFYPTELSFDEYDGQLESSSGYTELFEIINESLVNLAKFVANIPLIGTMFTSAFHTLILLIVSIYLLLNKKRKVLLSFLPLYVTLLICLITQPSGIIHLMPLIICTPVVISIFSTNLRNGDVHNENN